MPPGRHESGARIGAAIVVSLAALGYSIAVVVVAARAPDKGFLAFTGREVIDVTPGSAAHEAGIREGDVIVGIDGAPVISTLDYVDRLLRRQPGDVVTLELRRGARTYTATLELEEAPPPLAALAATLLAAVLLVLGLIARYTRPGDLAARRFFRTTVVFGMIYAGALSWTHLLVHPVLLAVFCVVLFFAAPVAADFALVFPTPPAGRAVRRRLLVYAPAAVLLAGAAVAAAWAVHDFRAGLATDRALRWIVRCVAGLLVLVVATTVLAHLVQLRRARRASGAARSQSKWLMLGSFLAGLPSVAAVPFAVADLDEFLLVGFRPFVIAAALLWFAANSLAVLRIRLADVDAIIHRSVTYGLASGGIVAVYLALVLAVGLVAERVGAGALAAHLVAAGCAAALFVPLHRRVSRWLDRRFFRDRLHYVSALRELAETASRVAEPPALARAIVEGSVEALRATGGAVYLRDPDGDLLRCAHAVGEGFPAEAAAGELEAPEGGVVVAIERASAGGARTHEGALVFGERRGGDLYSSEDRDLLAALAGQLAVAFDNASAFGTIAEMTRTLEAQNQEIRELRDKLEDENRYLKARLAAGDDREIVGRSKAIRELEKHIERVAASDATVLVCGESGTGKGLVARTLHAASARAEQPFIHVDCGAIPAGVFESELFGHERGAFTGAVRKRRGHVELADGGTLFLDEIGELPLPLQPKLLRALQERSFLRVGGAAPVEVDVRIVAATNRNLEDMVARGAFREDLFYRLRVVEITVPPLRQRKSDIRALTEHLLPRLEKRNGRARLTLGDEAIARLEAYGWPGNVRELENVLERAVVLCDGREIGADDLHLDDRLPAIDEVFATLDIPEGTPHDEVMEMIERKRLEAALRAAGGNQSGAARSLGMARTTFINKLRRLGLL